VIGLALAALPVADAAAWSPAGLSLEQRVERLERIAENQSLSDILLQLQRLQQEVLQLRGELELQGHALELLQPKRDLYPDIDTGSGAEGEQAMPASGELLEMPAERSEPVVPTAPTEGDPAQEEAAYEKAVDLLAERRYEESVEALRDFLARYPAGGYADLAQYWLGEAHYVMREFETARQEFVRLLEAYPQSPKVPGAMLKLGYIHYELRQWRQARESLRQLQEQYPHSTEARLAQRRLDQMGREGR